jgi:hypothetical protein
MRTIVSTVPWLRRHLSYQPMQPSSIRSSIYAPSCPCDKSGLIAQEKGHDVRNLLWLSKSPHRYVWSSIFTTTISVCAKHRSINWTTKMNRVSFQLLRSESQRNSRHHGIDPNPSLARFHRSALDHANSCMFTGTVDRAFWKSSLGKHACDVDDASRFFQ